MGRAIRLARLYLRGADRRPAPGENTDHLHSTSAMTWAEPWNLNVFDIAEALDYSGLPPRRHLCHARCQFSCSAANALMVEAGCVMANLTKADIARTVQVTDDINPAGGVAGH